MRRALVAALSLVLFVSCTADPETTTRPDPEPVPTETQATPEPNETTAEEDAAGEKTTVQVWFVEPGRDATPQLLLHHVEIPATQAVGRAAIEQLLRGVPGDLAARSAAMTIVPEDTELLGLTIEGGTARVDFNRAFEITGMGTSSDGYQIPQVVYTLTQFPTVKRVEFLLEGEPVEVIGGHGIMLDGPQTRKDWETALPPIVVESPYPGRTVDWTFDLFGIANVFEATVSWRLIDSNGKKIDEGFVTATCGTGCWGEYEARISIERQEDTSATLQVFESSAEDGSPLHMVEVPIEFRGP